MTLEELRVAREQAKSEYRSLVEKIETAKDKAELDGIELDMRKITMKIGNLDSQISAAEADENLSGDNDPALRKVEDELETRSLAPLNGVIKTAPPKSGDVRKEDGGDIAYRKAFMGYVMRREPIPAELRAEQRADEVTMTGDVDVLIPKTLINRILEEIENIGMILPLVTRT